jgi:mono/diheme cytochrome c family protein
MKKQIQFGLLLLSIVAAVGIFVFSHASLTQARVNSEAGVPGDAKTTFDAKCATCHGKDGRGKTFKGKLTHARDMTDGQWQNDVTDERLFNSISNGRNKMPAFKKKLSEAQIDELVAYVRRFRR